MIDRTLRGELKKLILQETIWGRHYIGKVLSVQDDLNLGRVSVAVFDLGLNDASTALKAFPRDKNSLTLPKEGDWVEVYFINWDRNRPVYMGIANEIQEMLPNNFDGTKQVIYESPQDLTHISFDENENSMEIGNSNMLPAARKTDATLSDNTTDSTFWLWLVTTLVTWANGHTHPYTGGTTSVTGVPLSAAPSSQTGKINQGSDQVNIGNS